MLSTLVSSSGTTSDARWIPTDDITGPLPGLLHEVEEFSCIRPLEHWWQDGAQPRKVPSREDAASREFLPEKVPVGWQHTGWARSYTLYRDGHNNVSVEMPSKLIGCTRLVEPARLEAPSASDFRRYASGAANPARGIKRGVGKLSDGQRQEEVSSEDLGNRVGRGCAWGFA